MWISNLEDLYKFLSDITLGRLADTLIEIQVELEKLATVAYPVDIYARMKGNKLVLQVEIDA